MACEAGIAERGALMDVLIVDDSRSMRMLIKRCMRQAGYGHCNVEEADNGSEGLTKLGNFKPTLILSDWNMMGMGGEQFATEVRSTNSEVAFGFITSEASQEIRDRAMSVGANFLITKPFDAETVGEAIKPYLKAA
jgi:two-component system chemotaxis response regulator CheY